MASLMIFLIAIIVQIEFVENCVRWEGLKAVSSCPKNQAEWEEAAKRKNCRKLQERENCQTATYHCLVDSTRTALVEVCTVPRNLNGYCPLFYEANWPFVRNDLNRDCSTYDSESRCALFYTSADAYKYQACYNISTEQTKVSSTVPQQTTDKLPVKTTSDMETKLTSEVNTLQGQRNTQQTEIEFVENCVRWEGLKAVSSCPKNQAEWEEAAKRKNCRKLQERENCQTATYHCLVDSTRTALVEVCTVPRNLNGYCPIFYETYSPFVKNDYRRDCSKYDSESRCASFYRSTEAYQYQACYNISTDQTKVSSTGPQQTTVESPAKTTSVVETKLTSEVNTLQGQRNTQQTEVSSTGPQQTNVVMETELTTEEFPTQTFVDHLKQQVEDRLKFLDTGEAPQKNID